MGKIGQVALVVGFVIVAYLLLLVVMPVLVDTAATANATITPASWGNYPGSQGALISAPWALFFVPGTIGIAAIVIILKKKP